jgi:hypothetical protein
VNGFRAILCVVVLDLHPASVAAQMPAAIVDSAYRVAAGLIGEPLASRALISAPHLSGYEYAERACAQSGRPCRVPWVRVAFRFRPSADTAIRGLVVIPLDPKGNRFAGYRVYGAPDCVSDPRLCRFIGADSAERVARAYGLPAGVRPWRVKFGWAEYNAVVRNCDSCYDYSVPGDLPIYAWEVETVTSIGPVHFGPVQHVTYVLIDAATGAVAAKGEYQREE